MKIIEKYIAKSVLSSICLVTLLLAGLQIFILFVNQLDDLGRVDFGIIEAAFYVLLQMPYHVYLFFPLASLLGSLVGLGILANHRELIVMQAAGMSISQITLAVLKAALVLIVVVTITGETLIPRLAYYGNDQKMRALSGGKVLRTAQGVWMRYQGNFILIGTVLPDNSMKNVLQFSFDTAHHMKFARKIASITLVDSQWIAHGVEETRFKEDHTEALKSDNLPWDVAVRPEILEVSSSEPDEMTLRELHLYLDAQNINKQAASSYQLAYWQRIIQPFTILVMMILSIPFIFGPLRSSTMGSKLLMGATVGFGFHIINRFFGPVSQVMQWPPMLAAIAPTLLFAILGVYLMKRAK